MAHPKRGSNVSFDEIGETLAADPLYYQLGQGETIIAVHRELTGICFEPLTCKVSDELIVCHLITIIEQECIAKSGAHQAGRVVKQHTDGDLGIAPVSHGELRDVCSDRGIQIYQAPIHQ